MRKSQFSWRGLVWRAPQNGIARAQWRDPLRGLEEAEQSGIGKPFLCSKIAIKPAELPNAWMPRFFFWCGRIIFKKSWLRIWVLSEEEGRQEEMIEILTWVGAEIQSQGWPGEWKLPPCPPSFFPYPSLNDLGNPREGIPLWCAIGSPRKLK